MKSYQYSLIHLFFAISFGIGVNRHNYEFRVFLGEVAANLGQVIIGCDWYIVHVILHLPEVRVT